MTRKQVVKLALRVPAVVAATANPVAYLAFFYWPNPEAPRWRFLLEWTLVVLSILAVVALIALLAVRAFA